jgi:hypothetical protein
MEPAPGALAKPPDLGPFQSGADAFKIGASYLFGLASIGYCLYAAATEGSAHHLQVLICIFGGTIGWMLGLYLTPDSETEKKRFGDAVKLVAALATGFGLGKADELLQWLKPYFTNGPQDLVSLRTLLFFCCLLIGGLFTYISRLHIRDEAEKQKQEREKLLIQARDTLEKLVQIN